jgi:opacity protein-like surface antigen
MKMLQKTIKQKNSILSKSIKGIALSFLFLFSVSTTQAQQLEVTPTIGYFWAGTFRTYNYDYKLGNGLNWGLTADFMVSPGTLFEVSWMMSRTDGTRLSYGHVDPDKEFKLTTNYIQLGVVQEMNYGEAFRPFGLFSMGTTIFSPENDGAYWQFSLGLGGGLKYYISDNIGIRAQGRFLLPVYFVGGGYWYGSGYASGSAIAQGDVSLGLVFVLQ